MSKTLEIGTAVTLLFPMLGNDVGAKGYVFATYPDFDKKGLGAQIIFENSEYDGFSVDEQEKYLRIGDVDHRYASYDFENVMQVSRDYAKGFWEF